MNAPERSDIPETTHKKERWMMITKDMIYGEIDQIEEKDLDDLYQVIRQFIR